jgi:hypothetical protein
MTMIDYFTDTPYHVELEKELCQKKQRIDVLLLEQAPDLPLSEIPDGLENLSKHNLLTYKSHHQPLDGWAIEELQGHYVNYRKQESPSLKKLIPRKHFRLYAACARFPQKLAKEVTLTELQPGVYQTIWGLHKVRIIVLSEVPKTPNNAPWHLFSGIQENIEYARDNYQWRDPDTSAILSQLCNTYIHEGVLMSYTREDMKRDVKKMRTEMVLQELRENPEIWQNLPVEDRLKGLSSDILLKRLSPEDRLKGLSPDILLKGLSPEDRLKGLSSDILLKRLSPEDRLKGLSSDVFLKRLPKETIETYLAKQQKRKK